MKNWIKSYWSNCLSITAIICSLVAICVSLPSAPELGIDYIGVIVGILSLLVTMLIGWQIYNAIIIEKKIKDEVKLIEKSFQKEIQAIKDESEIYIDLKFQLSKHNPTGIANCLRAMIENAIHINDPKLFSNVAEMVLLSKETINNMTITHPIKQIEVNDEFLNISLNILNLLPASNHLTPALLKMVNDTKKHNESIQKNIEKQ